MANGGEGGFTVGALGDGDVGGLKSSMTITRKISCSSEIMQTNGRRTRGMVNDIELKSGEDHF